MAVYSVIQPDIFVGAYDFSGDANSIDVGVQTNDLDVTTFTSGGWRTRISGLHDITFSFEAFTNLGGGNAEENLFNLLGAANQVVTVGETDATQGSPAFMCRVQNAGIDQPNKVGDAAQIKPTFKGSGTAVRGVIMEPRTTVSSSSSSGTLISLGAVGTTQYLYATEHLISFVGSATANIVTNIVSATNSSGLGATTRLSFNAATTASAQFATRVAGPITDTFWGATWTILGSGVSIPLVVAVGIQ